MNRDGIEAGTETNRSGMTQNTIACLSYTVPGIAGFLTLYMGRENDFVRFHSVQSILVGVGAVLSTSVSLSFIRAVSPLVMEVWMIVSVFLLLQSYNGEKTRVPVIGAYSQQIVR